MVIDFYNTLVRSREPRPSLHEVCREHGVEVSAEHLRPSTQEGADGQHHEEASRSSQAYRQWRVQRLRDFLTREGIRQPGLASLLIGVLEQRRHEAGLVLVPGAEASLRELHDAELTVVICSNWSWDLEDEIADLGLLRWCDGLVCSARTGCRKPAPEIFRRALAVAGGTPRSQAVMIGDHPAADGVGALNAGLRSACLIVDHPPSRKLTLMADTLPTLALRPDLPSAVQWAVEVLCG